MIITGEMPVDFDELDINFKDKHYTCSGTVWVEYEAKRSPKGFWEIEWNITDFDEIESCDENGNVELRDNDSEFLKNLRNIVSYHRADTVNVALRHEIEDWR